ncbi:redoxin domain-containing protein [Actinomycetospora sp. NBRC 106378]|uniref:redoxin domain-containing protein n=1 Tax=Actinomycetospora sp. NBRC 106378 TaxID=3032208 RepID=UPI00255399A0|nr:redoxin domain-containing protein [Actinomycetospora sp. NBRC 106378]
MRLVRALVLSVAALALVAGCSSSPGAVSSSPAPSGADSLSFSSTTLSGAPFDGKSLAGKPVVMWFWAPWCPTCNAEAPGVARIASQHPGVTFIGVAALDQVPAMKAFQAKYGLTFTQLADTDTSVWRHFGVTQQPAYAFIAPSGAVQVVKNGLSEEDLTQRLSNLT